jgi:uncharacterized membrane protein
MLRSARGPLLVCLLMLLCGLALKTSDVFDRTPYPGANYTDIKALYHDRALDDGATPYLDYHGSVRPVLRGGNVRGFVEYPVVTGGLMWLTAQPAGSATTFLLINAVVLGAAALIATLLLADLTVRRAYLFAACPLLAAYAFHNWELFAVALAVAGIAASARGRHGAGGALIGLGAAAKLFPGVLVVPLALGLLRAGERRSAARMALAALATFLAVNLPVLVANPSGWNAPYRFHRLRWADPNSIWWWAHWDASVPQLNLASTGLTVLIGAVVLVYAWRRGPDAALGAGVALLALAVALAKVSSPQYALWVLPFFALLRLHVGWWLLFIAGESALFYASFVHPVNESFNDTLRICVYLRVAVLLVLVPAFARARPAFRTVA